MDLSPSSPPGKLKKPSDTPPLPPFEKYFWKCPFPIIKIFCKSCLEELLILSLKRIKSIQIKVLRSRDFYIETQLITLIALIAPARRSAMICYKMHFFFHCTETKVNLVNKPCIILKGI